MNSDSRLKKGILLSAGIAMLSLLFVYVVDGFFPFGNGSIVALDLNSQYVPLLYRFYDVVTGNKNLVVDFHLGAGINLYSDTLTELLNPFNYVLLLFGRANIYKAVSVLLILYVMSASITANYVLSKIAPKSNYYIRIALSVSYGMSYFVAYQYEIIRWMYIVVLFPILFIALKRLLENEKPLIFVVLLAYILMLSLQFGIQLCIFSFAYSACYLAGIRKKEIAKDDADIDNVAGNNKTTCADVIGRKCLLTGLSLIAAVLISAFSTVPAVMNIMGSARSTQNNSIFTVITHHGLDNILERILEISNPVALGVIIASVIILRKEFIHFVKSKIECYSIAICLLLLFVTVVLEPSNLLWHLGSYQCFPVRYGYVIVFLIGILACETCEAGEGDSKIEDNAEPKTVEAGEGDLKIEDNVEPKTVEAGEGDSKIEDRKNVVVKLVSSAVTVIIGAAVIAFVYSKRLMFAQAFATLDISGVCKKETIMLYAIAFTISFVAAVVVLGYRRTCSKICLAQFVFISAIMGAAWFMAVLWPQSSEARATNEANYALMNAAYEVNQSESDISESENAGMNLAAIDDVVMYAGHTRASDTYPLNSALVDGSYTMSAYVPSGESLEYVSAMQKLGYETPWISVTQNGGNEQSDRLFGLEGDFFGAINVTRDEFEQLRNIADCSKIMAESKPVGFAFDDRHGNVVIDTNGLMGYVLLPMAYVNGWKCAQGNVTKYLGGFLAIELNENADKVELSYGVPGMKCSVAVSIIGLVLLAMMLVLLSKEHKTDKAAADNANENELSENAINDINQNENVVKDVNQNENTVKDVNQNENVIKDVNQNENVIKDVNQNENVVKDVNQNENTVKDDNKNADKRANKISVCFLDRLAQPIYMIVLVMFVLVVYILPNLGLLVYAGAKAAGKDIAPYLVSSATKNEQVHTLLSQSMEEDGLHVIIGLNNLMLDKKTKVTTSDDESATFRAIKAADGDTTKESRWSSVNNWDDNEHFLQADFKKSRNIKAINIYWERTNACNYTIEISDDGQQWTAVSAFNEPAKSNPQLIYYEDGVQGRFVRLHVTDVTKNEEDISLYYQNVGVCEFEVYDDTCDSFVVQTPDLTYDESEMTDNGEENESLANTLRRIPVPSVPEGYVLKVGGINYDNLLVDDEYFANNIAPVEINLGYELYCADEKWDLQGFDLVLPAAEYAVSYAGDEADSDAAMIDTTNDNVAEAVNTFTAKFGGIDVCEWKQTEGLLDLGDKDSLKKALTERNDDTKLNTIILENESADGDSDYLGEEGYANYLGEEGYEIIIGEDGVSLAANSTRGLYWGRVTLSHMIEANDNTWPCGIIRDYPEYQVRGFVLDVARRPFTIDFLYKVVDTLADNHMNTLQLHLSDNVIITSAEYDGTVAGARELFSAYRLESKLGNGDASLTSEFHYTYDEIKKLIDDAKAKGVDVVPEIDTPAHSMAFTKLFPELGFDTDSHLADSLDVTKPEVLEFTKSLWGEYLQGENGEADDNKANGEVAPLFENCSAINIGMDEYYGDSSAFTKYIANVTKSVKSMAPDKTIRMWACTEYSGVDLAQLDRNTQIMFWSSFWDNPTKIYEAGFPIINSLSDNLYIIAGNGNEKTVGLDIDYLSAEWEPNQFYGTEIHEELPAWSSQMLGACYALWNDQYSLTGKGPADDELFEQFEEPANVLGDKLW